MGLDNTVKEIDRGLRNVTAQIDSAIRENQESIDRCIRAQVCEFCKWHDDFSWVCFNPEAEDRADFTDDSYVCDCWEDKYVKEVSEV